MKARSRRTERRRGVRVVLNQRDEALLRTLARFRLARTSELLTLFFDRVRRDTALSRLRKLLDGGYVDVLTPGLSEENMYSLGPVGRAWADSRNFPHGSPPKGRADHHLAIVRVWSRLAAALHGHPDLRLVSFTPDWELRQQLAGSSPPAVADGDLEVGWLSGRGATGTHRLLIEVDLGTERGGELERKLVAHQLVDQGPESTGLVVVLVGAGARRRQSVEALVERYGPSIGLVCELEEWPDALLSRLVVHRQPPLTGSPDGKGSCSPATPSRAEDSDLSGERHSRLSEQGDPSEP